MSTLTATASLSLVQSFPVQVSASDCTSGTEHSKREHANTRQSACSKTIEELYLKNKRPARDNIVLRRKLQDQEVQVTRRRAVQVGFVSNMHVGLGLGLGIGSPDLGQIQSILNARN